MRKLKVPGRIIGKEHKIRYSTLVPSCQYHGVVDVPPSEKHPAVDRWVKTANYLRTTYGSPWKDDPNLQTKPNTDVDRDGRDRMGMPVEPPQLDIEYLRKLTLLCHLIFAVGISSNGNPTHEKRCLPWGGGSWGDN